LSRTRIALDFCLSRRLTGVLQEAYGHEGFDFIYLNDLGIDSNAPDPDWARAYKQFGGRVVLSRDTRIAYTPHLRIAFIDSGLLCFFPGEAYPKLKKHAQLAMLVHAWPRIAAKIAESLPTLDAAGACWRIPCVARKGDIRLADAPLAGCGKRVLEVPSDIAIALCDASTHAKVTE
jgi:hypothetical protein